MYECMKIVLFYSYVLGMACSKFLKMVKFIPNRSARSKKLAFLDLKRFVLLYRSTSFQSIQKHLKYLVPFHSEEVNS